MRNRIGASLLALSLMTGVALAQDTGRTGTGQPITMTPDQRMKMADANERMAQCLRSNRPLSDCHSEMMKSCQAVMGHGMCPMMGKGMAHGGPQGTKPPAPAPSPGNP